MSKSNSFRRRSNSAKSTRREQFDDKRFALRIAQHAVGIQLPARLVEQVARFEQVGAQPVRPGVGARRDISWSEHLRRQFGAEWFEQLQLARRWHALRREFGVVEDAARALQAEVRVAIVGL